jgi:hypothetical protein
MSEQGIHTHTSATDVLTMRTGSSQVREVAIGETLTVGHAGTVAVDSESAIVTGNTAVFTVPGRFTVSHALGEFAALAYEPGALDRVPLTQTSGAIGVTRTVQDRRVVLRSLATHSDWPGTVDSLWRYDLRQFGA